MPVQPRYKRPKRPSRGLAVQERDLEVLKLLAVHRYARADHFRSLLFQDRGVRVLQERLRRLFEHGLVDRYFVPVVLGTDQIVPRFSSQPIYALTARGAGVLAERTGCDLSGIPVGLRRNLLAFPTLVHDLVATDFTVSLCVALAALGLPVTVQHDHELRRLSARSASGSRKGHPIVPDAAVTVTLPGDRRMTFCLEVVRAGIRGGNRNLRAKLLRYLELHRLRFFREAYGHEWLRGVLVATTSTSRAEGLRTACLSLPHGHRLFSFGSYRSGDAEEGPLFTPENIIDHPWRLLDGSTMTLRQIIQSETETHETSSRAAPGGTAVTDRGGPDHLG